MHSLEAIPFAQLSDITPQYLRGATYCSIGLELLHSWQTASVLESNTSLVNYVCIPFFFFVCLSSLVKLCAERCFMTNSKPWGSALYTSVKVSCHVNSSEVAHFFLLFNYSAPLLELSRETWISRKKRLQS